MGLTLTVVGIVLSLAVALWRHVCATRAEAALAKTLQELPARLVDDLNRMISQSTNSEQDRTSTLTSSYVDLNGDGKPELMVSYLSGPHNTALQVFGMKTPWEFGLLGEIYGSTPTEFDVEDVDADGIPAVSVVEIAKAPDLPYVMGLRDRVSYKLTDDGFVEVKRVKGYTTEDLEHALASWHGATEA